MRRVLEMVVPFAIVWTVCSGPGCGSSSSGGGGNDSGNDQSVGEGGGSDDTGAGDSGSQEVGSNDTGGTDSGSHDTAGDTPSGDTGGGDGAPSDASSGDATTDGSDSSVCPRVSTLHPPRLDAGGASIFCPFSGSAVGSEAGYDGGTDISCYPGTEHCCDVGSGGASTCEPASAACTSGSTDWQCADPGSDCDASHPVCCAAGATLVIGGTGCGNTATQLSSTSCVPSGACSGIVMCTSSGECPSGKVCTPFLFAGNQVGGCL